jgi:hypothetical protein
MTIKFNQKTNRKTTFSKDKPILYINKVIFLTDDKNWINRLLNSSLIIKFACIDSNNKDRKSHQEPLILSAFITAYHRQPVMEINRRFSFEDTIKITDDSTCTKWKTTIELNNLTLKQNEIIEVIITDKKHILKRIKDWRDRIENLYSGIKQWLPAHYEIRDGTPTSMYEELMQVFSIASVQLDTIDIFEGNNFIMSFKPKGLWIIGANGRVEIISKTGNFILVDKSDQFDIPQWQIYTSKGTQTGTPFDQFEFLKLIDLLQ